jgi:hypothetical protein
MSQWNIAPLTWKSVIVSSDGRTSGAVQRSWNAGRRTVRHIEGMQADLLPAREPVTGQIVESNGGSQGRANVVCRPDGGNVDVALKTLAICLRQFVFGNSSWQLREPISQRFFFEQFWSPR